MILGILKCQFTCLDRIPGPAMHLGCHQKTFASSQFGGKRRHVTAVLCYECGTVMFGAMAQVNNRAECERDVRRVSEPTCIVVSSVPSHLEMQNMDPFKSVKCDFLRTCTALGISHPGRRQTRTRSSQLE